MKKVSSILAWCGAVAIASICWADSVSIRNADAAANSKPLVYTDVKVSGVTDGKLSFLNSEGNPVSKDFATVVGLTLDDEPAFNAAEAAFNSNKWAPAVDGYDSTITKTDKVWLKDYCETKLLDAADKSGRFDKAVDSYIRLVKKNPALAAKHKPTPPANRSDYLDPAAKALSAAADAPGIKQDQQGLLLDLLLAVDTARKDDAGVAAVASRINHGPAPAPAQGDHSPPAASGAQVDAKLVEIRGMIDQKKFDDAAYTIKTAQAMFTDAPHQAEALYLLAQAKEGQAAAKDIDNDAWKDAAVAYMRVVANFKDLPNKPHIADSLMHVAAIQEKLKLNSEAIQTYMSVVKDFAQDPLHDKAQKEADRLKASLKPS